MFLFRGRFFYQRLILVIFVFLCGCVTSSQDEKWKPVTRHDDNKVHVVKWADETLSAVASWYTGSSDNWGAIANANPTLNPEKMQQGDQVFIPQNLLKTRSDMSRDFLDTFLASPVRTVKTSSGLPLPKTLRIITPRPYKEKKYVSVDEPHFTPEKHESKVMPQPLPESPPESLAEEDQTPHLFGPK